MTTYTLNFDSVCEMTDERFYRLCQNNPDIKFEYSKGELIVMSPTGGETGKRNAEITAEFVLWNRRARLGEVFDSSSGFRLPNGSDRSPDVSWVRKEQWDALTSEQREKFPPIAPDFVLELMSPTDNLKTVQEKMKEYMDNGVRLGWLIDCKNHRVEIRRQGRETEMLQSPQSLSGEDVLPGFTLDLQMVWG
ncbi:Uma2 family endonuclease [Desulfobacterales bacterium HSG2]|nr:Uma2 family endonuclease [Desulfobacterales bacterium HSG2]